MTLDTCISKYLIGTAEDTRKLDFQDIVIIHNDILVTDWHNAGTDRVNFIFSCTKSVLSMLFGILSDQNKSIKLEDSITLHLPFLANAQNDYSKITLYNLLSMTSGISWNEMKRGNIDYNKMVKTDWIQYVLSKPVIQSDIGKFNYCDGNSLLLSAIITQYTGLSAHNYAVKYLFSPLDIQKTEWKEQNNVTMGGTGLHIKSLDLAKIGLLMLHNGILDNKQRIPTQWIAQSTQYQSTGYPEWFGNYGLHWWVSSVEHNKQVNMYFALGAHGQFLFIIPERNLVVCIRKKVGKLRAMNLPMKYLFDKILPYCK